MITTTLLLLGESSPVNSPFNTRPLPLIHSFQPFNIVAEVIKKKEKKLVALLVSRQLYLLAKKNKGKHFHF